MFVRLSVLMCSQVKPAAIPSPAKSNKGDSVAATSGDSVSRLGEPLPSSVSISISVDEDAETVSVSVGVEGTDR